MRDIRRYPVLDMKCEVPIEEERSKLEKSVHIFLYVFMFICYRYAYTARFYMSILSTQNHVKALFSH